MDVDPTRSQGKRQISVAICGAYISTLEEFLTAIFSAVLGSLQPTATVEVSHVPPAELIFGELRPFDLIVLVFNPSMRSQRIDADFFVHYPGYQPTSSMWDGVESIPDGPDFVAEVFRQRPKPILVITNNVRYMLEDAPQFIQAGALKCLGLPFSFADVEEVLRSIL